MKKPAVEPKSAQGYHSVQPPASQSPITQQPQIIKKMRPGSALNDRAGVAGSSSQQSLHNEQRNENILCAVLALLKELKESELELVLRDVDKKLNPYKNNLTPH